MVAMRAEMFGGPLDGEVVVVRPNRPLTTGAWAVFNYRYPAQDGLPGVVGGVRVMWAAYWWQDVGPKRGWHYRWDMGAGWRADAINSGD
jgi:hypothetical protein